MIIIPGTIYFLNGTATNIPKIANENVHINNCIIDNFTGPFSFLSNNDNAGIIPTNPAANGIVADETAIV